MLIFALGKVRVRCCEKGPTSGCSSFARRAGVLGANDGLVSVASLMLGVGGGTDSLRAMTLAGVAGLVGGALSMACGEYISVSSQRCAGLVRSRAARCLVRNASGKCAIRLSV